MLLKLDFQSETPIYTQLKAQIIEGIATGALKPLEPLPSVRQLAADLGINLHTVNKAYTALKQDGFITVHRQKGVVVNDMAGQRITEEYLKQLHNDLRPLIAEAICRGLKTEDFSKTCLEIFTELTAHKGEIL